MPKITLQPHEAPKVEIYKYFYNKLHGRLSYDGQVVPFYFSRNFKEITYPCVYLTYIRQVPYRGDRYIGDDVVALNLETGMFQKVSIGEPFESYWGVVAEAESRDETYALEQQIKVLLGRTGAVYEPFYVEHSRFPLMDWEGSSELDEKDAESERFSNRTGYRVYMRLAGGIPDPDYEPRPPIDQIVLQFDVDGKLSEEEVVEDA